MHADAAVLRQLRESLLLSDPEFVQKLPGWNSATRHPCTWDGVACDSQQHSVLSM